MNYGLRWAQVPYIPSFAKIVSGIRRFLGGGDSKTCRQCGDLISVIHFLKIGKVG
jgi:hypothetical protein